MIDFNLIKTFRNRVNRDSYFTLHKYKNRNGKNHWNLICACMDWIDVAVNYLRNNQFDTQNINAMSMQVYTYISSVDIVWQSIQQLHRAIIDSKTIPFTGEKIIFEDNDICKDDNEYFKHIRAVFGAHPVNITDKNGRWFASWPTTGIYDSFDIAVTLYSAEVENKDIVFGFRFDELEHFLQTRYEYLKVLRYAIDQQCAKYKTEKSSEIINSSKDILEQLEILRSACEDRLDNDYYKYLIEELTIIFEAKNTLIENRKITEDYRNKLVNVISELKENLQKMKFEELDSDYIIIHHHLQKIHYSLSKIYECLRGTRYDSMYSYYIRTISDFLKEYVIIKENMDKKEIFMLIKAGLYNYWKNQNEG